MPEAVDQDILAPARKDRSQALRHSPLVRTCPTHCINNLTVDEPQSALREPQGVANARPFSFLTAQIVPYRMQSTPVL